MFNDLKDLYKLQKEAKEMQKKMREKKITGNSKDGRVTVYMNGAQEYEGIEIDDMLFDVEMKDLFKQDMDEAFKDYQKKLQKSMQESFNIDDVKSMLGK
jgi:DNA-binding YbaB/EbfC family protein